MSRRSNGLVGVWAEAQRQQQRRQEAQARYQRDLDRQQRARQREIASSYREQRRAYREQREAEAWRRTEELDAQVASLQGLLAAGCRAPAFRADVLTRAESVPPCAPGQSAAYRQQYQQWAAGQLAGIRGHNAAVAEMTAGLRDGDPEAAVEYFSAALYASTGWPEGLPRQVAAAYDSGARQLVLNWELPRYDVVPEAKSARYMINADQVKDAPRPAAQRRTLYRDVLAQCLLLVLRDLFAADEFGALESVALNGFVDDHDPTTGRRGPMVLGTVMVSRSTFATLHLEQVNAVNCLVDGLRGQLSTRPDQYAPVRPVRLPESVGNGVVTHGGDEEPDLYEMDPIAFEALVAELFRAMGMQAVTTQRSNDGGVDVDALDPAPIRGGKIVVQVKRYRNTVPPTAVRDLYGTVQDAGANKGVLVTTSRFGPGAHTFANGKPLELVAGSELVDLLHRHGLRGRLGGGGTGGGSGTGGEGPVPAQRTAPDSAPEAGTGTGTGTANRTDIGNSTGTGNGGSDDDHNVLGMYWSGSVALDVCALVCHGNRVLDDDHFVFYNNPRTPDGTVRALTPLAPDKAAIQVAFDALPARADRLVVIAAVDPVANPSADLTGFTGAGIRLLDAEGTPLEQLDVSDGRDDETALVLGSFRRRANGDWDFVTGGRGYRGGLEELVQDYGIEVD
ncbi:restriction endonuclease [Streptomyces griseus]|uniref:Restriction endonuclease n=1 Tax=Streptomyces stephensoniae TaxID=3375367 RepID=A0ABU2W3V6_9ACTN|nr:restriction endonuclease [Streptomyces griseus]MDT0492205.1 restriction endonuclease [Streptomyces griseus]